MRQSEVSRVIWDWRKQGGGEHPQRPSLVTAGIGLVVALAVTALLFISGHRTMMAAVLAISLSIFSCALFFPHAYHTIQGVLAKFSFLVGQVLTWLLLTPFFYLVFSVGRLVQKVARRDPMTRAWQPDLASYWVDRPAVADKEQYKRQF